MPIQYIWFGLLGLVAGALAGQLLRGRFNVFVDIVMGVAGALLGGHLFITYAPEVGLRPGLTGGLVFSAIGAAVLLLAWRTTHLSD